MTSYEYRPLRLLGRHERYCLARHNIGHPPILCSITFGKAKNIEEIKELHARLRNRIEFILQSIPVFSAHVPDQFALRPTWAIHTTNSTKFDPDQVLLPIESLKGNTDNLSLDDAEDLLQQFQLWGKHTLQDLRKPPFWRVRLVTEEKGDHIHFAVVLISHHLIADGQGMMNLSVLLTQSKELQFPTANELRGSLISVKEEDVEGSSLPLTSDVTMRSKAPLLWTAWAWIKSRIMPILPSFLQRFLGYHHVWPHQITPAQRVAELPVHYRLVDVRSEDVGVGKALFERMKEVASLHNLKTVHPIFHTACIFALYTHLKYTIQQFPIHVKINSAAGERDVKKFGMIAGNYVSLFSFPLHLSAEMKVWQIARSFATDCEYMHLFQKLHHTNSLSTPTVTSKAGLEMRSRSWSLMPDVLGRFGEYMHKKTKQSPTPWEAFFGGQAEQFQPCKSSLGFSNLGLIKLSDPLFDRFIWTQYPPIGEAIMIDANGWRTRDGKEGLSFSCGIRGNGNWGPKKGKGEDIFVDALHKMLCFFAKNIIKEDDTFESIRQKIQEDKTIDFKQ